jgi:hypothetical protein
MNFKRKKFEYEIRETRDDYDAYNEILKEYNDIESELLDSLKEGETDPYKIKYRDDLNIFLANNEPYEIEESNFKKLYLER